VASQALVDWRTVGLARLAELEGVHTQNPRRSTLGSDFGRLGFSFIDDLKARGPSTERHLETLVDYRHAIGHGDESKIATIEASTAIRSTKRSYQQHRQAVNALAGTMDAVVARQLSALLAISRPW
jgi:hypothetical protein